MMHPFRFGVLALTAILTACSQAPVQLEVDMALQDQLRRIEAWEARGKLGVRLEDEAHSANFDWQYTPEGYSLRLSGPFGQGTTWLRHQDDFTSLESPDAPVQYADSAEQLMQERLGWHVPVSNLQYWIKGIAAPAQKVTGLTRNADGTLAELQQQGWQINYSRYQAHNGWALPGKLVAQRGPISLTVIVKDWNLPEPATSAANVQPVK